MFYKFAKVLVILFLCIAYSTLFLCISHAIGPRYKLPSTLNGNGILIVPQKATAEHTELPFDFGYHYVLSCKPKPGFEIKIIPNPSKNFHIIDNFPPGKYTIDGYNIEPAGGWLTYSYKQFRTIPPFSFNIEPNKITMLSRIVVITMKAKPGGGGREYSRIKYLTEPEKQNVLTSLEKAKNYKLWGMAQGHARIPGVVNKGSGVVVSSKTDRVSQTDIERVKREAENANTAICSILAIEKKETIEVCIVDEGIVHVSGGILYLPVRHVKNKKAAIVSSITYMLLRPTRNRFFSAGLGTYFQERFGEDDGFPRMTGEPLDDLVRQHKDQLVPIHELANNNQIFRQVGSVRRKIAFIEAGSFHGFLVERYGEEKIRELHDSAGLKYGQVYGKNLTDLEVEWMEFVFK